ncbi:hypothetical protein GCM10022233_44600 [Streptomyces shaanxiensis]|uniref:Uncharacterized protein n=1 Tax=Streptomyces shaanxiensis TaxID=653357 RepID=A0ABP7VDW5_9ACTN
MCSDRPKPRPKPDSSRPTTTWAASPPGDCTAAKRTTSAERHKAERLGRERAAREELRETVRRTVSKAADPHAGLHTRRYGASGT